jgi:hypothetical protein
MALGSLRESVAIFDLLGNKEPRIRQLADAHFARTVVIFDADLVLDSVLDFACRNKQGIEMGGLSADP